MQTATENLKKSLDRQTPVYGKSIMLYRKLWTGSAYVFDTPVEILDEIIDAGKIMWKLDKEGFNVWSVGNTTLTIRNHRNQWKQNNPKGFFPSGYLLHGSKVVIRAGAQLADGTFENPYIFTGYITTDPIKGTAEKTAVITLEASMAIFGMFNAEEISNPIIDEQHDYSAPDIVDYNTINNGVAAVGFVVKRGATAGGAGLATEIFPTTGYTIQNQNLKTLPITVTLVSALTDTESLWFTYKYWYQDKTLEWLVAQVCALCGVTSTSITPAIFSSSAETIWDFNSQADWNTCTLSNIDTITTPGSFKIGLIDDFGDGDYTANPSWELIIGDASIESGHLKLSWNGTHSSSTVKLPFTTMVGNWQFRMWSNTFSNARFWIIGGTPNVFNILDDGYYIDIGNDSIAKLKLANGGAHSVLINTNTAIGANDIIRVSRTVGGNFEIFINEISKGTVIDNTISTNVGIYCQALSSESSYFDDMYFWENGTIPGIGILKSLVKDTGGSLTAWGKLTATYTANGASILIETAVSSDNINWDAWMALDGSGQILSAIKRYIKYRVTATLASMTNPVTPIFDEISIKYYTSTIVIDLVDLTGLKCDAVLNICSQYPCYEMGFNASDTFIYRPRSTTLPSVKDFSTATNVQKLQNIVDGVDRVYNRITAQFGIYTATSDTSSDTEPTSKTKYGDKEYQVSSSSLLPAENVNIAYAIAPTILAYSKIPRRRCQAVTKLYPYLELGDKVNLTFNEPTALRLWKWGDADISYRQSDLEYYSDETATTRLSFYKTNARIEGIEFAWWGDMRECIFDLVEVL